ncbi:MAG: 1-deoxy-D-xylulose-5-phosphate synthase [Gemmatimonadetes bacterium]|nr:MAG: 1-deoxy-D-xylulose-5-phosphate synthase [Gemmatimonadota bacterium]
MLERIRSPEDVRALSREELHELAREARERHIDVISQIGGHFGASLGVVELTVALHYVFDTPRDKLVWDTGHQGYIHKILTGRNDRLPTIRQDGGLAPFLARWESEYDHFGAGHAATSISAALGTAIGRDHVGEDFKVVAIIGDGAMGCGLAYEALNNAGHTDRDLIVILNDNDMSIAPNVGAMNKYLTGMITHPVYNRVRDEVKELMARAPGSLREIMEKIAGRAEGSVKGLFVPGMVFEELGFRYIGPVDGHDLDSLVDTLSNVKRLGGPILVHALTQKGKGFHLAEEDAYKWHAASPFDKITGAARKKSSGLPRYQKVFGRGLRELGERDPRLVVITAGMPDGTSTDMFGEAFPDRFIDVGIAESHAVCSAAGMATVEGVKPVVCIYSTFLQRGFDNIVHDVALQNLPVLFCMDRAGIAGPDGPTHHGTFDINYMLLVPGMTVTAPKDGAEMLALTRLGTRWEKGPFSVRWPRDAVPAEVPPLDEIPEVEYGTWEVLRRGSGDIAILAVGTMVLEAEKAAAELAEEGIEATVVNCRFLKPYDREVLGEVVRTHGRVLTVEEGAVTNGFGAYMAREIAEFESGDEVRVRTMGIPDHFIQHGSRASLLRQIELDAQGIADQVRRMLKGSVSRGARESA